MERTFGVAASFWGAHASGVLVSAFCGDELQRLFRQDAETKTLQACAPQKGRFVLITTEMKSDRRPWYRPSLTTQIMIGLVIGALIGWLRPDWGNKVYFLRDIFINLIKSIIAPLVFSTIV
ncbi:MAG TPA: cation:dicarboxylase symporter family transporter, partial [Chthoniobacterales bacterium]